MSRGYEERYLITLLSAVINQKPAPEPLRQLSWEKVFRLSDYHHVAHLTYYGIMGLMEDIPQAVRQKFFDKYLEAVFRAGRLQTGEEQLEELLERKRVSCMILNDSRLVGCYPIPEMCCRDSIEIAIGKGEMRAVEWLMEGWDFEKRRTLGGEKSSYYRVPGIRVRFLERNTFFSQPMRNYYKYLLYRQPIKGSFAHVRELELEEYYIYLMCGVADNYATNEIEIAQMIDLWEFFHKYEEELSWQYIYTRLRKLKIFEFTRRAEGLLFRWFGDEPSKEDIEIYDAMEAYILTKGSEGREISSKFLPLVKRVADCYDRNRKAENFHKLMQWMFPDRRYMESIYPRLGKFLIFLPLCWILRLSRSVIRPLKIKLIDKPIERVKGIWYKWFPLKEDLEQEENKEVSEEGKNTTETP